MAVCLYNVVHLRKTLTWTATISLSRAEKKTTSRFVDSGAVFFFLISERKSQPYDSFRSKRGATFTYERDNSRRNANWTCAGKNFEKSTNVWNRSRSISRARAVCTYNKAYARESRRIFLFSPLPRTIMAALPLPIFLIPRNRITPDDLLLLNERRRVLSRSPTQSPCLDNETRPLPPGALCFRIIT